MRRKRGNRKLICSGCGRKFTEAHDYYQREVRDLPHRAGYQSELPGHLTNRCAFARQPHRILKVFAERRFPRQLRNLLDLYAALGTAHSVQFDDHRGLILPPRAIDLRHLQRWSATRRKEPLKQMGVDEIYFGKHMRFITVVSNLETGEPLWFGQDRKQETLDEFFQGDPVGRPSQADW